MSSLFEQVSAISTDKPVMTKYGHTAPGEGSGMDENPSDRSAAQPQGDRKTDAGGAPESDVVKTTVCVAEPQNQSSKRETGIEHFQP
ncbi:hypothetical protein GGS26DRAFT_597137 [Hypomontagnella submonticulosa]|nr:hypothetical protein GGS26DRAFT_597137 [Hypomontagnella submonticulosa]